jgi:hypothetical protein
MSLVLITLRLTLHKYDGLCSVPGQKRCTVLTRFPLIHDVESDHGYESLMLTENLNVSTFI